MTTVTRTPAQTRTAVLDSPVGPLTATAGPRGLVRLAYEADGDRDAASDTDPMVAGLADELDRYFCGEPLTFSVPVDLERVGAFTRSVLRACAAIGYGETVSYGELAHRIGRTSAARAVGGALGANPVPIVVPCHRVVRGDGSLGGYGGGSRRKRFLLALEQGS